MSRKGFTMIELLIVIGVLGILAVGVLAAVDPFEQLKKARDTNTRQSVISLHTALTRYYATHANLPWDMGANLPTGCPDVSLGRPDAVAVSSLEDCIVNSLESDGELKTDFVKALGEGVSQTIFVTSSLPAQVSVCFAPQSKPMFQEEGTKFTNNGTLADETGGLPDCTISGKAGVTPGNCYYCAK